MTALIENEQPRLEVKLACSRQSHPSILSAIRSGPVPIRPLHPTRVVNSLYFDTHDGQALAENLSGQSNRKKYRLRWYGHTQSPEAPVLECKIRENRFGTKKRLALGTPIHLLDCDHSTFMKTLLRQCTLEWQDQLRDKVPVQWISYERAYFSTWDEQIRITVDRDLEAYDQRFSPTLTRMHRTPAPDLTIIELKAPPECERDIQKIVANLPADVDKCSKFVLASSPSQAPTPSFWEYV